MVNLVELTHVVELLDRYASRSIVNKGLRTAGLDRVKLSEMTGFIPYAAEAVLLEAVARAISDRHLGAKIGRDFNYAAYGAYSHFVLGAPDLASALDRGRRALLFIHPGSEIVLRETATHLVVGRNSQGLSVIGHQHLDEGALFVIGHVARHFLGSDWSPDWVEIPNANADGTAELAALLNAPVRIGLQMPSIAIRRTDLLAPNPGLPEQHRTISLKELGALMGIEPAQTMEDTVAQLLHVTFANGPLALFNLAVDSKLRGCDLVRLRVSDLVAGDRARERVSVVQSKTNRPVQFEVSENTRDSIWNWVCCPEMLRCIYLFPSRFHDRPHVSTRQCARLVRKWVAAIGLDPSGYGTHSLRRTKAALIYRKTGNLRAVQLLLGHTKVDSTVRYLGVELEDALSIAEKIDI